METYLAVSCALVGLLPILYWLHSAVRFYLKVALLYVMMAVAALMGLPLAAFTPGDPRNINYSLFFLRRWMKVFDIHWEYKDLKYLQTEEPVVVVSNHQSALDIVGMLFTWPYIYRCAPVIKKELLYAGPFGIMAWLSGCVFVNRANSSSARKSVNDAIVNLQEKKTKLWIFPEGTRNDSGTFLNFKKGAFHVAIQAQVPIVPVVFSSYLPFYDPKLKKFLNGGKVTMACLPPVSVKGKTTADIDSLIDEIRNQMLETYFQISEVQKSSVTPTKS